MGDLAGVGRLSAVGLRRQLLSFLKSYSNTHRRGSTRRGKVNCPAQCADFETEVSPVCEQKIEPPNNEPEEG